jgi:hypothetical protein
MDQTKEQNFAFPKDNEKLTKQECAIILQKALASSSRFKRYSDLAKAAGFSRQIIGDYLYARRKPPRDKWTLLHGLLSTADAEISTENNKDYYTARIRAERLRALKFAMMDDLEYFRDSTIAERSVLKKIIPGKEVGYLSGLFSALYDEDQLKIWLTFSNLDKEA